MFPRIRIHEESQDLTKTWFLDEKVEPHAENFEIRHDGEHMPSIDHLAIPLPSNQIITKRRDKIAVWSTQTGQLERVLGGKGEIVSEIIPLADGRIAACHDFLILRIWNTTSGRCEITLSKEPKQMINALIQLRDGRIASVATNIINIWNLKTCLCDITIVDNINDRMTAIHELSNGYIATGHESGAIKLWNIKTGLAEKILKKHNKEVLSLTELPNNHLVSRSTIGKVSRIWDINSGKCEISIKSQSPGHNLLHIGDGLFATNQDKQINIWDTDGKRLAILKGHTQKITHCILLQDEKIASIAMDGTIKIWNMFSGECHFTLTESTGLGKLLSLPDGRIAFCKENVITIWDIGLRKSSLNRDNLENQRSSASVKSPSSSSKSGMFYPSKSKNMLEEKSRSSTSSSQYEWFIEGKPEPRCEKSLTEHSGVIHGLVELPNEQIVSCSADNTIKFWNTETAQCDKTLTEHLDGIYALIRLPDGRIVTSGGDKTIKRWDTNNNCCDLTLTGHKDTVTCLVSLPNNRLASSSKDSTIMIWNLNTGKLESTISTELAKEITALAALQDGRIVSVSGVHSIQYWKNGTCVKTEYSSDVVSLLALVDGRLAVSVKAGRIDIYDTASYERSSFFTNTAANALVQLPNGNLASGSENGTIQIWEIKPSIWRSETNKCILEIKAHDTPVRHLAVRQNGKLVSCSDDKVIKQWDIGLRRRLASNISSMNSLSSQSLQRKQLLAVQQSQWVINDKITPHCEKLLRKDRAKIDFIHVLPDDRIVGAYKDGSVMVWDKTGTTSKVILGREYSREITCCTLHPDDIAIGYSTGEIVLLRIRENFKKITNDCTHKSPVTTITMINNNYTTGHEDGTIQPWDGSVHHLKCSKPIRALLPLPNGKLASDTWGELVIWNVKTEEKAILDSEYSKLPAVFLFDGRIARLSKNSIKIWDSATLSLVKTLDFNCKTDIDTFIVLPDGRLAITFDAKIQIWDIDSKSCSITLTAPHSISTMLYLPNGWLCAKDYGSNSSFWDINNGKLVISHQNLYMSGKQALYDGRVLSENGEIYDIGLRPKASSPSKAMSPPRKFTNPSTLSTQNNDKWVIDEKSQAQSQITLSAHDNRIQTLLVISDTLIATGSLDTKIKIWNTTTGKCLRTLEGHKQSVIALFLLSNGRFASTSQDNTIKIWNADTGKCERNLTGSNSNVHALAELKNGRIIIGTEDGSIRIVNTSSGQISALTGHDGAIRCLRVISDEYVASSSDDVLIKLWNINTEQCDRVLSGHTYKITTIIPLSDGRLASASLDKSIKIWNLDTGKCEETLVDPDNAKAPIFLSVFDTGQLLSYSDNGIVSLWNLANNQKNKFSSTQIVSTAPPLVLSNGRLAVVSDRCVNIWNIGLRKRLTSESTSSLSSRPPLVSSRSSGSQPAQNIVPRKTSSATSWEISFEIKYDDIKFGMKPTDVLGAGGFGIVVAGTWLHNDVAIKKIKNAKPSVKEIEDFKKECQILSTTPSNYIVRFFGCCFTPSCCIVMERMEKGSLRDVLRNDNNLTWKQRYQFMYDIARGLAFLHAKELIHQDIKSLNILIDKHYQGKIGDLGLAKLTKSNDQSVAGTLPWMAPELFKQNAKSTKESDIYSTGVTFWETISNRVPLSEAKGDPTIIKEHVTQGKREAIPSGTPTKIANLIQSCWHQDPTKRPTAEKLVTALAEMASDFEENNSQELISGPQYRSFN